MNRILAERRTYKNRSSGCLVWVAPDNKAYSCSRTDMIGVKEITEWNKQIKEQLTKQAALL